MPTKNTATSENPLKIWGGLVTRLRETNNNFLYIIFGNIKNITLTNNTLKIVADSQVVNTLCDKSNYEILKRLLNENKIEYNIVIEEEPKHKIEKSLKTKLIEIFGDEIKFKGEF